MKYAFGIDLGTTNSCIAVKTAGEPAKVIPLADGRLTLPSCVMYKDGQITVGYEAYAKRYDTKHVVYSSKRDIGSDKVYTVYANGDDQPPIEVTPVDVASEILKKLKHDAELLYGEGFIKDVTITVPAYFTLERRVATTKAAEMAGLNVIALINEPTAAAIAYTEGKQGHENILIYDLGGGTFDVTLLEMIEPDNSLAELFGNDLSERMAKVIASSGDPVLGGDDLDHIVLDLALDQAEKELQSELNQGINIRNCISDDELEKALLTIERNKKRDVISSVSIPVYAAVPGTGDRIVTLHAQDSFYEEAFERIYARTKNIVADCLSEYSVEYINRIILVGGSTKLQLLRDKIASDYKLPIHTELNPDEAVALGAATNSAILMGDVNMTVSDILPQSIGIECIGVIGSQRIEGRFNRLIPKNTALPTSATAVITTSEPGQTEAVVPVYQGEDSVAENNLLIGTVILNIKPCDEVVSVHVTLTVNASGVLQVKLASEDACTSVKLQNVLRPTEHKVSKGDKFAKRYEILLRKYAKDSDEYIKGSKALADYKASLIKFIDLKKIFDDITLADRKATASSIAEDIQSSSYAKFTTNFEDDEDEDNESDN